MALRYVIWVRPIQGGNPFKYSVESYEVEDGFVVFKDIKTGVEKRVAVSNTEIHEIKEGSA